MVPARRSVDKLNDARAGRAEQAALRPRGYDTAPAVFVLGSTIACAAGLLRIAADAHRATDVLLGAGLGTAVGVLVPSSASACSPKQA